MNVCEKCGEPCEVITRHWREQEIFWGAPCWRDCYEDASECCEAEVIEEEEQEGVE